MQEILGDSRLVAFWEKMLDRAYRNEGNVDYWDYQWGLACWANNGLVILPTVNLVENIGFGKDATHTRGKNDRRANIQAVEIGFPLEHPPYMVWNKNADITRLRYLSPEKKQSNVQKLYSRIHNKISRIFSA